MKFLHSWIFGLPCSLPSPPDRSAIRAAGQKRTIKLELLKLAGLVRISARRIKFALPSACPYGDEWHLAALRLTSGAATPTKSWQPTPRPQGDPDPRPNPRNGAKRARRSHKRYAHSCQPVSNAPAVYKRELDPLIARRPGLQFNANEAGTAGSSESMRANLVSSAWCRRRLMRPRRDRVPGKPPWHWADVFPAEAQGSLGQLGERFAYSLRPSRRCSPPASPSIEAASAKQKDDCDDDKESCHIHAVSPWPDGCIWTGRADVLLVT